jgi:hypothetical protein
VGRSYQYWLVVGSDGTLGVKHLPFLSSRRSSRFLTVVLAMLAASVALDAQQQLPLRNIGEN